LKNEFLTPYSETQTCGPTVYARQTIVRKLTGAFNNQ